MRQAESDQRSVDRKSRQRLPLHPRGEARWRGTPQPADEQG